MLRTFTGLLLGAAVLALAPDRPATAQAAGAAGKPVISKQDDLPRHTYPVPTTAAALVAADDTTFNAWAAKVAADADATLNGYEITDRATRRKLLGTRVSYERLSGRPRDALATVREIRALEEKPDAKLTSGLRDEAMLRAWIETGQPRSPAFEARFKEFYGAALKALPFAMVANRLKQSKSSTEIQTPALVAGVLANDVEPVVARTGGVTDSGADDILWARDWNRNIWPLKAASVAALREVVAANTVPKADIWRAREVELTAADRASPVVVAVWDSGVDTALFAGRLHAAPGAGGNGHGLSFDVESRPEPGVLRPLDARQQADYAATLADFQGFADNQAAIDSPAAEALRAKIAALGASETGAYLERLDFFGDYIHGTHVAGILARGNPYVRIGVIRDTFDTRAVPAAPTDEKVARRIKLFQEVSAWLKANEVRVVNLSWGDAPKHYESALEKNGVGKDAAERKAMARRFYDAARDGFAKVVADNPNTLFIAAAGNSDADNAFEEFYPSALVAPNLLTASAVDLAGDEASFTSYGKNVLVSANGYQVESMVPGGQSLRESGTSMAAPNVANLAAKLIALQPSLTPAQVIALIRDNATTSADGRRRNIHAKASVAALKTVSNGGNTP